MREPFFFQEIFSTKHITLKVVLYLEYFACLRNDLLQAGFALPGKKKVVGGPALHLCFSAKRMHGRSEQVNFKFLGLENQGKFHFSE
jgi:hypothetical protein